jgi:hypothetical protein
VRDQEGRVREVRHPDQPYSLADAALATTSTPQDLATQYILEIAPVLGLPAIQSFATFQASQQSDASLIPAREKSIAGATVVPYSQHYGGMPVWQGGLAVRLSSDPLAVIGAVNDFQYDIDASPVPAGSPYLPAQLQASTLASLLSIDAKANQLLIGGTRLVVTRYDPADRTEGRPALPGEASRNLSAPPVSLALPPVPMSVQPGHYYIVTEVLFTLTTQSRRRSVNWRAFVEPTSGAVLYLRALVASAMGSILPMDPVTQTGELLTAATADARLDGLRAIVELSGLAPSGSASQGQMLSGEFVQLIDREPPTAAPPRVATGAGFVYSAKTSEFAAVSAYHHCDAAFRMITSLGMDVRSYFGGTTFPVTVDHYALDAAVNAQAPGNATGTGSDGFNFGVVEQGQSMGIAVDSRIVLHEFGHVLLWNHVGSPNLGFSHSAGDTLAAVILDAKSRAPDRFITFPFITASSGVDRRHDRATSQGWAWGGIHDDTGYGSEQILSTTLFRVYRLAGGDSMDPQERADAARYVTLLIVKGIGMLTLPTRNVEVFANTLMDADATTGSFDGVAGGILQKVIRWSFEKQGLYQPSGAALPVAGPGAPPSIDVYVDDGSGGEYMVDGGDPLRSGGMWNRTSADGAADHQVPIAAATNYLYVRLGNRGTEAATAVSVEVFASPEAGARTWPAGWTLLPGVPIAGGAIAAQGRITVGPIPWVPGANTKVLLVSVSTPGDTSNSERIGPGQSAPVSRLVRCDNNMAQRTMS